MSTSSSSSAPSFTYHPVFYGNSKGTLFADDPNSLVFAAEDSSLNGEWSFANLDKVSGVRDSDSNEIGLKLVLRDSNKPVYLVFETVGALEVARHQIKDKLKEFRTKHGHDTTAADRKENRHQAEPISYGVGIASNKVSPSPPPTPRHDHHQPSPQFYPVKESVHQIPLPNPQGPLPRASVAPFFIVCGVLLGTYVLVAIILSLTTDFRVFNKNYNTNVSSYSDPSYSDYDYSGGSYRVLAGLSYMSDSNWFYFSLHIVGFFLKVFFLQYAVGMAAATVSGILSRASYVKTAPRASMCDALVPTKTTLMIHGYLFCMVLESVLVFFMTSEAYAALQVCLSSIMTLLLYMAWLFVLEDAQNAAFRYASNVEALISTSERSIQCKSAMMAAGSFRNAAIDQAYQNAGFAKSPAYALAESIGMYVILGKLIGTFILLLYFLGFNVYQNLFVLSLVVVLVLAIYILGLPGTLSSLMPLARSNAIHAGEIVALSRPGKEPGHDSKAFLVGFIEGFSGHHVVMRDFKKNQSFIPYREFATLVITNWSRRPAKSFAVELSVHPNVRGGVSRLSELCDFARKWIKNRPDLDQNAFARCALNYGNSGCILEVAFSNRVGCDMQKLRHEFIVTLMDTAETLNLCLSPCGQHHCSDFNSQDERAVDDRHAFQLSPPQQ